jgi:hypothetical protein
LRKLGRLRVAWGGRVERAVEQHTPRATSFSKEVNPTVRLLETKEAPNDLDYEYRSEVGEVTQNKSHV